jgi:hypothetical protein
MIELLYTFRSLLQVALMELNSLLACTVKQVLVLSFICFVGFAYQAMDIVVFRFIIEYSSLMDFGPN